MIKRWILARAAKCQLAIEDQNLVCFFGWWTTRMPLADIARVEIVREGQMRKVWVTLRTGKRKMVLAMLTDMPEEQKSRLEAALAARGITLTVASS